MNEWAGLFLEALRLDRWPASRVRDRAGAALERGTGGFVLFGGDAEEVADLTGELRRTAARPLWIAADLERGAGQQFRGATELPPPAALAAHPEREEVARMAGRLTGREARALGVNWVLAPVLDLDAEPRNPIVGTRSFGADPQLVARLGRSWIGACQGEGVAACAKHFPGHGRTVADSHATLPVVTAPRPVLERDLEPFRAAVGRVATVMTAHVAYPALGADGPATFSPSVLAGLLRGELGFRGVVASDAMIMEGFRRASSTGARPADEGRLAARAVAAGCDVLLYPRDLSVAVAGIAAAAEHDPAFAARARDALERSRELCVRYPADGRGEGAAARAAGHPERVLEVAAACVGGRGSPAGAGLARDRPTWVVRLADGAEAEGGAELPGSAGGREPPGRALAEELRGLGWTVAGVGELAPGGPETGRRRRGGPEPGADAEPGAGRGETGEPPAEQTVLVVDATPRAWRNRARLSEEAVRSVRRAAAAGPVWTVVLGHPRVLGQLGVPGCWAWAAEPLMQRAAARWLDARLR